AVDRLALFSDALVVIDAEGAADADEPRLKVGSPVERIQRLEDLEEDLLREIFGFIVLADELVAHFENFSPVVTDDGLPSGFVAAKASPDQCFDGLRCERCRGR